MYLCVYGDLRSDLLIGHDGDHKVVVDVEYGLHFLGLNLPLIVRKNPREVWDFVAFFVGTYINKRKVSTGVMKEVNKLFVHKRTKLPFTLNILIKYK